LLWTVLRQRIGEIAGAYFRQHGVAFRVGKIIRNPVHYIVAVTTKFLGRHSFYWSTNQEHEPGARTR
jgi:hypothetical protein